MWRIRATRGPHADPARAGLRGSGPIALAMKSAMAGDVVEGEHRQALAVDRVVGGDGDDVGVVSGERALVAPRVRRASILGMAADL